MSDTFAVTFGASSVLLLVHAGLLASRRALPGVLAHGSVLGSACMGVGLGFVPLAYALGTEGALQGWVLPVLGAVFMAVGVRLSNRAARQHVAS